MATVSEISKGQFWENAKGVEAKIIQIDKNPNGLGLHARLEFTKGTNIGNKTWYDEVTLKKLFTLKSEEEPKVDESVEQTDAKKHRSRCRR